MLENPLYTYIVMAIAGGLLTLLSSVGIFISLIVQRRLDRLQDILEEFIDLSYRSEINLTGKMYNLIEKYQMHYLFPRKPQAMILRYIDLNILFILVLWSGTSLMHYQEPFSPLLLLQLAPLGIGIYASLFFRRLLRNTVNLETPLLDTIIPAPVKLRSISYLSHFVNISVKSILKQARLTLHCEQQKDERGERVLKVYLKEELSFDDFFYFLLITEQGKPCFLSCGEVTFCFPPDQITGKPVPAQRNVNVPLGQFRLQGLMEKDPAEGGQVGDAGEMEGNFLVFTRGEKHPIQFTFRIKGGARFISSQSNPEITVNHQIMYQVENNRVNLLECPDNIPYLCEFSSCFHLKGERYYLDDLDSGWTDPPPLLTCREEVFID